MSLRHVRSAKYGWYRLDTLGCIDLSYYDIDDELRQEDNISWNDLPIEAQHLFVQTLKSLPEEERQLYQEAITTWSKCSAIR